ncbi:50S ribosomal protein L15e [uncultured archaeon]|nr:50S ribosomal protein L15e [uncultured archaeon]
MGAYGYIAETMQKEYSDRNEIYRGRLILWRKSAPIERVERPTNLTRARTLGYKAKVGYAIVRARVKRGMRKRPKSMGGRKAKSHYSFKSSGRSHQTIAEQRVNSVYKNMEVLNSYWVGDDGSHSYYEVILVDPTKVSIGAANRRGRAFRGLTSVGHKGRPSKKVSMNKKRQQKQRDRRLAGVHGRRAAAERASA